MEVWENDQDLDEKEDREMMEVQENNKYLDSTD